MANKKDKNYKIFRVEVKYHKGRKFKYAWPKKIVMQYIYAKDDKDAYDQLKKYRKIANKEYTYYVEPYMTYHVIGDDETYDLDIENKDNNEAISNNQFPQKRINIIDSRNPLQHEHQSLRQFISLSSLSKCTNTPMPASKNIYQNKKISKNIL